MVRCCRVDFLRTFRLGWLLSLRLDGGLDARFGGSSFGFSSRRFLRSIRLRGLRSLFRLLLGTRFSRDARLGFGPGLGLWSGFALLKIVCDHFSDLVHRLFADTLDLG